MTFKYDKKKNEIYILVALVLIHIVFLYIINNYARRPETYRDELILIGVAKSMVGGTPFMVHGVPIAFTNVLYPLVISPAFLIADTIIRLKVLTLINCVLVSITIIPVYFICKELDVSTIHTWLVIGIMYFWPDMTISGTFMSENLYFPLVAFTVLFVIKTYKNENILWAILAGIFTYLVYNCKEVGLCIFLGYISVELVWALMDGSKEEKRRFDLFKHIRYKQIAAFTASFVICYVLVRFVFMANNTNPYIEAGSSSLQLLRNSYVLGYLVYSCLYYVITVMIAFFILPVVLPLVRFKQLNSIQKKGFLFGLFSLLCLVIVIGVMITIKEDLVTQAPVVHLRYIFPLITIFLPIFFSMKDAERTGEKSVIVKDYYIWGVTSLIALLMFKGLTISSTTGGLSLLYCYKLSSLIGDIKDTAINGVVFYSGAYIVVIVISLLTLAYIVHGHKEGGVKKKGIYYFSGIALALCVLNFVLSLDIIRDTYSVNNKHMAEMYQINEYFRGNNLCDLNVMYVGSGILTTDSKIFDFYFDSAKDMTTTRYEELVSLADADGYSGYLSDLNLNLEIWDIPYNVDTIDYFIIGDGLHGVEEVFDGVEKVEELSNEEFVVLKNIDNTTLKLKR